MYRVFVRNWWKLNPSWPFGLEPHGGAPKHTIARNVRTEEEAQRIAQQYNDTHESGRLDRKAEYERQ